MKKLVTLLALKINSLPAAAQDMSDGAANFYVTHRHSEVLEGRVGEWMEKVADEQDGG